MGSVQVRIGIMLDFYKRPLLLNKKIYMAFILFSM